MNILSRFSQKQKDFLTRDEISKKLGFLPLEERIVLSAPSISDAMIVNLTLNTGAESSNGLTYNLSYSATVTDLNPNVQASDFSTEVPNSGGLYYVNLFPDFGDNGVQNDIPKAVINPTSFYAGHHYSEEGTFAFSLSLANNLGVTYNNTTWHVTINGVAQADFTGGAYQHSITITDPSVIGQGVSNLSFAANQSVTATLATFTDPGGNGDEAGGLTWEPVSDFSAMIDWGDGTTSAGTIVMNYTSTQYGQDPTGVYSVIGSHTYSSNASANENITVTINHEASTPTIVHDSATVTGVVVADHLTAGSTTITNGIESLQAGQIVFHFTDSNLATTAAQFSGNIRWGDLTVSPFDASNFSGANGVFTVTASHVFGEEGSYNPLITIRAPDGTFLSQNLSPISISDPSVIGQGVQGLSFAAGQSAPMLLATFNDPAGLEALADYSASINWGDGSSSAGTITDDGNGVYSVYGSHAYATSASANENITVTINHEASISTIVQDSATVTGVIIPDQLTAGSTIITNGIEGGQAGQFVFHFTDANTATLANQFTGIVVWGDGYSDHLDPFYFSGSNGSFTLNAGHTYSEEGSYTPNVYIQAPNGAVISQDLSPISIADAPPTITLDTNSITVLEGNVAVLTGSFSDYDEFAVHLSSSIGEIAYGNSTFTWLLAGVDASNGPINVVFTAINTDGSTAQVSANITIVEDGIHASAVALPSILEGDAAAQVKVANFTHANGIDAASEFSASINWGIAGHNADAGTIIRNSDGSYSVMALRPMFAEAGNFAPIVTISEDNVSANVQDSLIVVEDGFFIPSVALPSIQEGDAAAIVNVANFTHANGVEAASEFSASINWGIAGHNADAGTIIQNSDGSYSVMALRPMFAEAGNFAPIVTISEENMSASVQDSLIVTDAPLTQVSGIQSVSMLQNQAFNVILGAFTDANPNVSNDFVAKVNWGDNTTSTAMVAYYQNTHQYQIIGSHTYQNDGNYNVSVQIFDDNPQVAALTINGSLRTEALWGLNAGGDLFSIGNYNNAVNTIVDHGLLYYMQKTSTGSQLVQLQNLNSFAINPQTGIGYIVSDNTQVFNAMNNGVLVPNMQGFAPALMSIDLHNLSANGPNIVNVLGYVNEVPGTSGLPVNFGNQSISAIAFDPNGQLYGMVREGGGNTLEDLAKINLNPANGVITSTLIGAMTGSVGSIVKDNGHAMKFIMNSQGQEVLYVSDNKLDLLYTADWNTGRLLTVADHETNGLNSNNVNDTALAYDRNNGVMLDFNSQNDTLGTLSLTNGSGSVLASMTQSPLLSELDNVIGLDFYFSNP